MLHQRLQLFGPVVFGRCSIRIFIAHPFFSSQINRMNSISVERERRKKEGLPVPTTISQDAAAGDFKLPFTNVK